MVGLVLLYIFLTILPPLFSYIYVVLLFFSANPFRSLRFYEYTTCCSHKRAACKTYFFDPAYGSGWLLSACECKPVLLHIAEPGLAANHLFRRRNGHSRFILFISLPVPANFYHTHCCPLYGLQRA